jgi:hypothetical protein
MVHGLRKIKKRLKLFAEHLENTFTPNTGEDIEDELDEINYEETGIIPRHTERRRKNNKTANKPQKSTRL